MTYPRIETRGAKKEFEPAGTYEVNFMCLGDGALHNFKQTMQLKENEEPNAPSICNRGHKNQGSYQSKELLST